MQQADEENIADWKMDREQKPKKWTENKIRASRKKQQIHEREADTLEAETRRLSSNFLSVYIQNCAQLSLSMLLYNF